MKKLFCIFSLTASLFLTGCGFHLRGDVALAPQLGTTHVQAGLAQSELERLLARQLRAAGSQVAESGDAADSVIRVTGEQVQREVLAVNVNGRAIEYELIYQVGVQVRDAQGKLLLQPFSLQSRREFLNDEANVLGAEAQSETLLQEMRRDMAHRIVRRINQALN